MECGRAGRQQWFVPDLVLLSGAFFFLFLGPGAVQQHLGTILGDKRFFTLAAVYVSFCVWRIFIGITIRVLGDFLSELLGAATYVGFVAVLWVSTSWPAVLLAAALWGWGAASLWITSQSQVLDATRGHGSASGFFYSILTAGQALGVGLLALIAARWPTPAGAAPGRLLLATCVVLGLPGLVLVCLTPRRKVERERFTLSGFWRIARQRAIVLVGVILLCSSLSFGILLGAFSELSRATTGAQWPAIAFYVARVALCFPAGLLADRIGKERGLKFSFLLAAAGIVVAALWRTSPGLSLAVCAGAMAMQQTLAQSSAMALMGDVAEPKSRHLALGAVFFWRDLGVVIPLFVAGLLKGLLPDPGDAQAVETVFRAALLGFAAVFVGSAFLCDALRRALTRTQGARN